jgi:hypothetical protein
MKQSQELTGLCGFTDTGKALTATFPANYSGAGKNHFARGRYEIRSLGHSQRSGRAGVLWADLLGLAGDYSGRVEGGYMSACRVEIERLRHESREARRDAMRDRIDRQVWRDYDRGTFIPNWHGMSAQDAMNAEIDRRMEQM